MGWALAQPEAEEARAGGQCVDVDREGVQVEGLLGGFAAELGKGFQVDGAVDAAFALATRNLQRALDAEVAVFVEGDGGDGSRLRGRPGAGGRPDSRW